MWVTFFCIAACSHGPENNAVPKPATTGVDLQVPASHASSLTEAPTGTATYVFSSASGESSITFEATGAGVGHGGSFASFNGTISLPNGALKQASVSVDIDLASLRTDDPKLTEQLKSSSFLDVARFPRAHFSSTSVESGGALGATNTVRGSLQLHGVTRPIDIPGTLHVRQNGVDVDAKFPIRRREFKLRFAGKRDALVNDEIIVSLVVVASPS